MNFNGLDGTEKDEFASFRNPKFGWQSTAEKEEIIPRRMGNRAQPLGGINGAKKGMRVW